MSKLREHFLKLEQESTKATINQEIQRCKDEILQAANFEPSSNDNMIKIGDDLLIEASRTDLKKLLSDVKNAY